MLVVCVTSRTWDTSRNASYQQDGHNMESLERRGLVRVSPSFRVIALGLPVPEYLDFPLDPPLRSRFQGRYISATPPPMHPTGPLQIAGAEFTLSATSAAVESQRALTSFWRALAALRSSEGGLLDIAPRSFPCLRMRKQ